ncbi:MAG: DUF4358 domain-containing protein [Eubacteriales bacterium]|nr:DUF4358 domain-containing protein [Eubacteriales bacterium]
MKKILSVALVLIIMTLSSSCSAKRNDNASAKEMFDEAMILLSYSSDEEFYYSGASEKWFLFNDDVLSGKYGEIMDYPELDTFVDYAAFFSTTSYGPEFGIFRMNTEEQAKSMKLYIDSRISQMIKYAINYPVDTTLIKNYTVTVDGVWVYYAATENNSGFNKIVKDKLYS